MHEQVTVSLAFCQLVAITCGCHDDFCCYSYTSYQNQRLFSLQGISGPQKFQVHKSYGPQDRLPSAHTCFNQLDILEYDSKEQLNDRLMVAIHEGSEGFGFG